MPKKQPGNGISDCADDFCLHQISSLQRTAIYRGLTAKRTFPKAMEILENGCEDVLQYMIFLKSIGRANPLDEPIRAV